MAIFKEAFDQIDFFHGDDLREHNRNVAAGDIFAMAASMAAICIWYNSGLVAASLIPRCPSIGLISSGLLFSASPWVGWYLSPPVKIHVKAYPANG